VVESYDELLSSSQAGEDIFSKSNIEIIFEKSGEEFGQSN
jgi:hypothetical protein